MGASHGWIARAAWAWVLSVALGVGARAGEPWQVLPPTPQLPPGTVSHFAEIHGARIWYAEWGRKAQGVPVLLLHGGFANSNYFGHLIPVLVERGYTVIAMDSRGHGRSTRTNVPQTYHQMAQDVLGLIDTLHVQRVSVVGWSDGGDTGLDLAINHPERIAGLFTFGANSEVSGTIDGGDKTPVFAAYLMRARDEYRVLSPTPRQWASFEAAMTTMWGTLPAFTSDQLRSIKVPITVADGEHDEVIKPEHTKVSCLDHTRGATRDTAERQSLCDAAKSGRIQCGCPRVPSADQVCKSDSTISGATGLVKWWAKPASNARRLSSP